MRARPPYPSLDVVSYFPKFLAVSITAERLAGRPQARTGTGSLIGVSAGGGPAARTATATAECRLSCPPLKQMKAFQPCFGSRQMPPRHRAMFGCVCAADLHAVVPLFEERQQVNTARFSASTGPKVPGDTCCRPQDQSRIVLSRRRRRGLRRRWPGDV
jgi:hypothetical protein